MISRLAELDRRHLWHPFTPMRAWCAPEHEPLILQRGQGVWLYDAHDHRYFDGNSSIWTNLHGHSHPALVKAIQSQAATLAHVSALGSANEPSIRLAQALVDLWPVDSLTRVFFSDDGSTAIECALKMAIQYWQMHGTPQRDTFLTFDHAYHGDTLGAAPLGGISRFHERFQRFGLPCHRIADESQLAHVDPTALAGVVIEPVIQGAAGMKLWPHGMMARLRAWCDAHGVFLIADEVMTGFGRTGTMFACHHDGVVPDFLALAKGLTGGTMPLAATLTTERVFTAFLNRDDDPEDRTFYYGHSYSGHAIGCAAALANLAIFKQEKTLAALAPKIIHLAAGLAALQERHPVQISATRQAGFIAALDVTHPTSGAAVCLAARRHGLLTRPIRDTIVLMPPLCATPTELDFALHALSSALTELA
jgi:adenosylmethionine---8-amino-7-oxononanoate aminotransferase